MKPNTALYYVHSTPQDYIPEDLSAASPKYRTKPFETESSLGKFLHHWLPLVLTLACKNMAFTAGEQSTGKDGQDKRRKENLHRQKDFFHLLVM